jgi:hypothetical protein
MLLQRTGWLDHIAVFLRPLMGWLRLSPEAALPILTGIMVNIYASIAVLGVIPFTLPQMTLIAIFNLIAHSLIMEGVVQYRSGINIFKATLIRLLAAFATVFIVSRLIGDAAVVSVETPVAVSATGPFLATLRGWVTGTGLLLARVLVIIMLIATLLEVSREMGWIDRLLDRFRPVMQVLGLPRATALMFVAGIVFGLLYGSAIIVAESNKGTVTREEVQRFHFSLGVNHSMVEDPLLFAVLGVNLLWLWIPRLIMAIIVVQGYLLWCRLTQSLKLKSQNST